MKLFPLAEVLKYNLIISSQQAVWQRKQIRCINSCHVCKHWAAHTGSEITISFAALSTRVNRKYVSLWSVITVSVSKKITQYSPSSLFGWHLWLSSFLVYVSNAVSNVLVNQVLRKASDCNGIYINHSQLGHSARGFQTLWLVAHMESGVVDQYTLIVTIGIYCRLSI